MKARELMIGNIVMRREFLPRNLDNCRFDEIVVTHNDITACYVSENDFKFIPLTEEWLLKFGFELKNQLSIHKTKIYYISKIDVDYCLYFADFRQDFGFYIEYTDSPFAKDEGVLYPITFGIKYVHQLQNLYFALTGEELTDALNDKAKGQLLTEVAMKLTDNQKSIPHDFNQIITENFNDLI